MLEGQGPRSDEAFQKLLLEFSALAAAGTGANQLIATFCRNTREFFQVAGAYFWRRVSNDELLGEEADGLLAEQFAGIRLRATQSAVAVEAIQRRKTVYVNRVDPFRYPLAAQYRARSIMAAPLVVSNEVIGAAVYLHDSDPEYFDEDLAAKATILAGQLGSLLEASRLTEVSREEYRRAEILAEVAQALHAVPDPISVMEGLADRLRMLLRTRLVCVLLREPEEFVLRALAADSVDLTAAVRSRHERRSLHFEADIAHRAALAGEPITIAIDPSNHGLGDSIPAGSLLAAPFRTARTQGAVLIYPRAEGSFTSEERILVSAVAGFGAVAIANAELYKTARAQASELHQLVEISSELGSIGNLDQFLQQFSLRAADFLGFCRAFIGLLQDDGLFHVRWGADHGAAVDLDVALPDGIAGRALLQKEVFWTNDPATLPGANLDAIARFEVRQFLAVPLLGSEGRVLGMFGVLDRVDQAEITQEDVRRAKALASNASVALEVKRSLHISEAHRKRSESLMALALELNPLLRVPDFARGFVARAADMMETAITGLAVKQGESLQILAMHGAEQNTALFQRLAAVLDEVSVHDGPLAVSTAKTLLGGPLAAELGWRDCTLVRLSGTSGDLLGVLCLANRDKALSVEDRQLLQAIAAHASIALENACLFTRMDQANRHWMEIFDAITDFIVVHDQTDRVLRINRSLADFVGVELREVLGLKMGALFATGDEVPFGRCPFCSTTAEPAHERFHNVLERTYLVSTSRVHGATSEGLQTIHVFKDVTDRQEAERRYRELFDNIQEGLFFSTPDGRFIEVNEAMVRMLGYDSREELLQVDIPSALYFSPEQRDRSTAEMQEAGWVLRNFEDTLRRKDGSPVHVMINAMAVVGSDGRVLQYRGLMLDISGLKAYQSELQRERDFSGKILNNTQNLIVVVDTAGLITYVNRRWREMGYQQSELLGRSLEEVLAPSRRSAFRDALHSAVAGNPVENLEAQIAWQDGRLGQFSLNLSPMRDDQGNVNSIVVVMTDITDAASLQAKLMHAEKLAALGQLVSGVAHEVNNPLTAILGFADLLMENPEMPDSARKDLRVILQEAQRTKQIVQNLLSFARQMPPQRESVQVNAILRRTIQLRAYDFRSHGIEVIEQFDRALPNVVGDSHQLQQVFLNILNNAYDAVRETGRPPRIEVMTTRAGEYVEISFRDNGEGIAYPDRIFDPFFTTKEVGKGTGLGLSICYGIVREHAGEIFSQNNTDSEGATFVVRLPASEAKGAATSQA